VLAGTGSAAYADAFVWWKALLALVVSLALQVGVNYANDYSDGVRGTDEHRVGPLRLVGSGLARPAQVKAASFAAFGVAAVAGLVLAATTSWWLIAVGAAAIVAAWFYTGGSHPYGYHGLGEVFVFVFFGLVAVVGTAYVQVEDIRSDAVLAGYGVGALACAILVANNLRDIPTDRLSGKRTLAVVLGDAGTRVFYIVLVLAALAVAVVLAVTVSAWMLFAFVCLPLAARAATVVRKGADGPQLIPVLKDTGLTELVYATGLLVGYLCS
jgi:1,4-dihydroxy-2-naphthoate octaprenyltransferase